MTAIKSPHKVGGRRNPVGEPLDVTAIVASRRALMPERPA
jgi:hypothetical protein